MNSLENRIHNRLGSLGGKRMARRGKSPSTLTDVSSDAAGLDRLFDHGELRKNAVEALSAPRGKITPRAVESRLTCDGALRFQSQVIRRTTFGIVLPVKP